MSTIFSVILDDFFEELTSLEELMNIGQDGKNSPRVRVASVNSTTLILAATFEEFIRQMALQHARQIVENASEFSRIPDLLLETAWRRTLDDLARKKVESQSKRDNLSKMAAAAKPKFEAVCKFLDGDTQQDIYDSLIHNESNMRASEINALFKVSGTSNICQKICDGGSLKEHFGEEDAGKVGGRLLRGLEEFFERRNTIAHSLNAQASDGPEVVRKDLGLFRATATDLCAWLDQSLVPDTPKREVESAVSVTSSSTKSEGGWFEWLFGR